MLHICLPVHVRGRSGDAGSDVRGVHIAWRANHPSGMHHGAFHDSQKTKVCELGLTWMIGEGSEGAGKRA